MHFAMSASSQIVPGFCSIGRFPDSRGSLCSDERGNGVAQPIGSLCRNSGGVHTAIFFATFAPALSGNLFGMDFLCVADCTVVITGEFAF